MDGRGSPAMDRMDRRPVVVGEFLFGRFNLAGKDVCPACSYPAGYHSAGCPVVVGGGCGVVVRLRRDYGGNANIA